VFGFHRQARRQRWPTAEIVPLPAVDVSNIHTPSPEHLQSSMTSFACRPHNFEPIPPCNPLPPSPTRFPLFAVDFNPPPSRTLLLFPFLPVLSYISIKYRNQVVSFSTWLRTQKRMFTIDQPDEHINIATMPWRAVYVYIVKSGYLRSIKQIYVSHGTAELHTKLYIILR
jgi:hypothetical protein